MLAIGGLAFMALMECSYHLEDYWVARNHHRVEMSVWITTFAPIQSAREVSKGSVLAMTLPSHSLQVFKLITCHLQRTSISISSLTHARTLIWSVRVVSKGSVLAVFLLLSHELQCVQRFLIWFLGFDCLLKCDVVLKCISKEYWLHWDYHHCSVHWSRSLSHPHIRDSNSQPPCNCLVWLIL